MELIIGILGFCLSIFLLMFVAFGVRNKIGLIIVPIVIGAIIACLVSMPKRIIEQRQSQIQSIVNCLNIK